MLEYIADTIKSAGPLIIFGSFVIVFSSRIFPDKESIIEIAKKNKWTDEQIDDEIKLNSSTQKTLFIFVIIGVCFGLAYVWINQTWGLGTSLGLMSLVGLLLFSYIIRLPTLKFTSYVRGFWLNIKHPKNKSLIKLILFFRNIRKK